MPPYTAAAVPQPPVTDVVRNPLTGEPLDLNGDGRYDARMLDPSAGNLLPALGLIVEL